MAALRILFPYTGDSVGGSHISSLILARGLRDRGYEVVPGLHHQGGALEELFDREGVAWIPLPAVDAPRLRAPWRQFFKRRAVAKVLDPFLREQAFDLVHTHDMRNHRIWSAATMLGACPHIWHQRTPASGKNMAHYGRKAAAFIAVSEFTRSSLPAALQPFAHIIYNPFLPGSVASPEARLRLCGELGVSPETRLVGYVANFSERKRPELFVEIAGRVAAASSEPLAFCMFGAPHEPFRTRALARAEALGLADRLHILGQRFPFGPYMAGLSALVAPARREALGRTLIEAGLAGVPVVATAEGGNFEIIEDGETGWLASPDDADAFCHAILEIFEHPDATERRCDAAREKLSEQFSLERHLARVEGVYSDVLGRGASP